MLYFDLWTILVHWSFDDSSHQFVHVNINIFILCHILRLGRLWGHQLHYPFDTEIYPVHSVSHLSKDWGLEIKHKGGKFVLQEKIHVLMSTVFDAKMLKGGSQEKRDGGEECKMEEAGAVWTPCFPQNWLLRRRQMSTVHVWWCKKLGKGATHDKIYMVLYTIFTENVPLSYTFYWKYYPAYTRPT